MFLLALAAGVVRTTVDGLVVDSEGMLEDAVRREDLGAGLGVGPGAPDLELERAAASMDADPRMQMAAADNWARVREITREEHNAGTGYWEQWLTSAPENGFVLLDPKQHIIGIPYKGMGKIPAGAKKTPVQDQEIKVSWKCNDPETSELFTQIGGVKAGRDLVFDTYFPGLPAFQQKHKPYAKHIDNSQVHVIYEDASDLTTRPSAHRSYLVWEKFINCEAGISYTLEQIVRDEFGNNLGIYVLGQGEAGMDGNGVSWPLGVNHAGTMGFEFTQNCGARGAGLQGGQPDTSTWNCSPGKRGMFLLTGASPPGGGGPSPSSEMTGLRWTGKRMVIYLEK